ncbi:unnamed protein product, partial [Sphagnum troendelagicum]
MKIMRSSCLSLNKTLHKEGGVLCPLCKARHLQQNKQVITCGCGKFQLDTQDDQVCNLSVHSLLFQSKYVCLNMLQSSGDPIMHFLIACCWHITKVLTHF